MVTHRDGEARTISSTQHGLITRAQALAIGFSSTAIDRRVSTGLWTRIGSGLFTLGGPPGDMTFLAAATLRLPAVVSHGSAARLLGLRGVPHCPPTVTVPFRLSNKLAGVRVHQSTDLRPEWVSTRDGLPTTTAPRTLFDLGATLRSSLHRSIAQKAIIDRHVTLDDLEDSLRALGRRGRPGTTAMRDFLEWADHSFEGGESELERLFINLIRSAGLPEPRIQADLPWRPAASGRVDFLFDSWRLIVEVDGRAWHTTAEAFARDRHRDNAAQLAGYRVLRFTWEDLTQRPHTVLQHLRSARPHSRAA